MTGKKKHKYLLLISLSFITALIFLAENLVRFFWYDEALTVMEFVMLPSTADIYHKYTIPNNHILYSIILNKWISYFASGGSGNFILRVRFLSFLFTFGVIACLASLCFKKRLGLITSFCILASYIFSWQFNIYALSIRGYMLSCLAGIIGCLAAMEWKNTNRLKWLTIFFLSSLVAVATIPSNLILFLSLGLFILFKPLKNISKSDIIFAVSPVFTLLFYAGISEELLALLSEKRGWQTSSGALWHLAGGFVFTILPLFIAGFSGIIINFLRRPKLSRICEGSKLLITVTALLVFATLLLSNTPYPRIFVPVFPVFIFALACGLKELTAFLALRFKKAALIKCKLIFFLIIIFWGYLMSMNAGYFSGKFTPEGEQDDLVFPYYVDNFNPQDLVYDFKEMRLKNPLRKIFIHANADPISIIFIARMWEMEKDAFLFDKPKEKVSFKQQPFPEMVVVSSKSHLEKIKNRFQLNGYFTLQKNYGFHKVYLYQE